jgi:hypothetical protein
MNVLREECFSADSLLIGAKNSSRPDVRGMHRQGLAADIFAFRFAWAGFSSDNLLCFCGSDEHYG